MTLRIVFRPEAEAELSEAVDWYETRGRGLGAELLRSLDAVLSTVQRHPVLYPTVFGQARRAVPETISIPSHLRRIERRHRDCGLHTREP